MSAIKALPPEDREEIKLAGIVLKEAGVTMLDAESKNPPIVNQIIQEGPKTFSDIPKRNTIEDILNKKPSSEKEIIFRG